MEKSQLFIHKLKIILLCIFTMYLISCSYSPQITYDPVKDARTCVELLKEDPEYSQEYYYAVIYAYFMEGMKEELETFLEISLEGMEEYGSGLLKEFENLLDQFNQ